MYVYTYVCMYVRTYICVLVKEVNGYKWSAMKIVIISGMYVYCCAINGFKMYNCDLMIQDEVLSDNHQLNYIRNSSYSPYQLKVRPRVEPDQVKVEGPGVSSKGIPASLPAEFTIDTTQAGYGDLEVQVKVSYWQTFVSFWNLHNLHTHEIQLF